MFHGINKTRDGVFASQREGGQPGPSVAAWKEQTQPSDCTARRARAGTAEADNHLFLARGFGAGLVGKKVFDVQVKKDVKQHRNQQQAEGDECHNVDLVADGLQVFH